MHLKEVSYHQPLAGLLCNLLWCSGYDAEVEL